MKQLLVVKPNTISLKDKEKLTKNGFILIEHPFPGDVRLLTQFEGISSDDILQAALDGSFYNSYSRETFGTSLLKRIRKEPKKPETP